MASCLDFSDNLPLLVILWCWSESFLSPSGPAANQWNMWCRRRVCHSPLRPHCTFGRERNNWLISCYLTTNICYCTFILDLFPGVGRKFLFNSLLNRNYLPIFLAYTITLVRCPSLRHLKSVLQALQGWGWTMLPLSSASPFLTPWPPHRPVQSWILLILQVSGLWISLDCLKGYPILALGVTM